MTQRRIPPAALTLGLAGLLPFLWAAASHLSPSLAGWAAGFLSPLHIGAYLGLTYGSIILAFMSGALWGFASRAGTSPLPYALSVIPSLWVFFTVSDGSDIATIFLIAGFIGLLLIDATFAAQDLTPPWWMKLRLILTLIVVACLAGTLL